jgi:NAD(P)-dependent dehydrogenase (short-subunit alcohol dehydrogenase family)
MSNDMKRFEGSICLVTGAAKGIGAAIAARFASEGATVLIAGLHLDTAQIMATEIGHGAVGYGVDVSDSSAVIGLFDRVIKEHGVPNVVVNNAGIASDHPSVDLPDEVWQRELDVNLSGTFFGAREAARRLIEAGKTGVIVNISSIAGFRVVSPERHVGYDATKAAISQMTKVLAYEWAPHGIRVNAVGPGYTDTDILKEIARTSPEIVDEWLAKTPYGRLLQPSEIAAVVCFLASDDASAITGQTVMADGGYSL